MLPFVRRLHPWPFAGPVAYAERPMAARLTTDVQWIRDDHTGMGGWSPADGRARDSAFTLT